MADHYYSFTHDKGLVFFTDGGTNKTYCFNINDGTFTNTTTGKPVKGNPAGFGPFLKSYYGSDLVVQLLSRVRTNPAEYGLPFGANGGFLTDLTTLQQIAHLFVLVDKIQSLGVPVGNSPWHVFQSKTLLELDKYFKDFAKYARTTDEPTISDFLRNGGITYFAARHNLEKYHLSEPALRYLYNKREDIPEDKIEISAYYLGRGLYDFAGQNAFSYLRQFFSLCEKMDKEPPKEDFYRTFVNFKREYDVRRKDIDAAKLRKNYDKKRNALSFEFGDYVAIIPETAEDFRKEADAQNNCVFSNYLERVLDGYTYVVFVRHKDSPERSLVTCEVNNSRIWQFLGACNRPVSNDGLLAFKDAYQKHLNATWNN